MAFPGEQFTVTLDGSGTTTEKRLDLAGKYIVVERIEINGRPYDRTGFVRLRESAGTSRALLLKSGDAVSAGEHTDNIVVDLINDSLDSDEELEIRGRVFDRARDVPDLSPRTMDNSQATEQVAFFSESQQAASGDTVTFEIEPSTVGFPAETFVLQTLSIASGADTLDYTLTMSAVARPTSSDVQILSRDGQIPTISFSGITNQVSDLFPLSLSYESSLNVIVTNADTDSHTIFVNAIGYVT